MIEAVGHEFLSAYFASIDACLRSGGLCSIQAICVPNERYESYSRGSDFIRKHIFPGSHLVCLQAVEEALVAGKTSLTLDEKGPFSMSLSYAKTLREWRRRFSEQERDVLRALGTAEDSGEEFLRKW